MALTQSNASLHREETAAGSGQSDMRGFAGKFFRGDTDQDIVGIVLRNDAGTYCYVYPNAAGNGLVTSTVKP